MLCSVKELKGFSLAALDGEIGQALEIYFDDQHWVVRHVVAETAGWLSGRKVLISPHSINRVERAERKLMVSLTRRQIEEAPGIDADKPVSRQQEIPYYDYYGYPYYWSGSGLWGMDALPLGGAELLSPPGTAAPRQVSADLAASAIGTVDRHLRSSIEVGGYKVDANDGSIGHVDDVLIDDRTWQIRLVVIDTHNWLPDRLVLVSPASIISINWVDRRAHVDLTRAAIKASPPYERSRTVSRDDALKVDEHYRGWH